MSEIIDSTYRIIGELGSGGGGVVYLAEHLRLGKKVVLKADKRSIRTREALLRREVDVLKELSHPYIPQVYDYFIEDDTSYTVMDYVEGESLDKLLKKEGRFSQPVVIGWARQLLEALAYLHSPTHGDPPRGYVHSDVKPANIMLKPNGDICLIDFNISLAIGIESMIGKSEGYSSPEHYNADYCLNADNWRSLPSTVEKDDTTEIIGEKQAEQARQIRQNETTEIIGTRQTRQTGQSLGSSTGSQSLSVRRVTVIDARSDIYSVGATLYHLLSGKRPHKDATRVEPLRRGEFSQPLADIVTKAMSPDPKNRFGSAEEMLKALNDLWKNDPRTKRRKRQAAVAVPLLSAMFVLGGLAVFTGLRQMERLQAAQVLTAASSDALAQGDVKGALDNAMNALVDEPGIFDIPYTAGAQLALTNALGVYDLSDSFKPYYRIDLPSEPFRIIKSPDETRLAASCSGELRIYELESGKLIRVLETPSSALCEAEFLSDNVIVYAGSAGLAAYDIAADKILWQAAEQVEAVALSASGRVAAAVSVGENAVYFYDTDDGELISYRELDGRRFDVPVNSSFADPGKSVFELDSDGGLCAVSLADGYLGIMDIYNAGNDMTIYEESDNTVFDGLFFGDRFVFSAAGVGGALFGIVDCAKHEYIGSMTGNSAFLIKLYHDKLYVKQNDTIIEFDMDTFEQTETAYTENKNITAFDISEKYAVASTKDGYTVFCRGAGILQSETAENAPDMALITDNYAVLANRDSPCAEVLKMSSSGDSIISYDPRTPHDEARLLADRSGVLLFDINSITFVNTDGTVRYSAELPAPGEIFDQQYRRDGEYLEVIYYSGRTVRYSAETGGIIYDETAEPPGNSLDEEFETESLTVRAPLHGVPAAYDKETGELVAELNSEDHLTYITQVGDSIVAQYISSEGKYYGVLMNERCEPTARLPYLCDISDGMLVFDFPSGNIKVSPIYSLEQLKEMAADFGIQGD